MRRTAALAALVAFSVLVTPAALGGPPRLEQKRLRAADMALARRVTLRRSDLPPGWANRQAGKQPEQLPRCPGADLDFSAFTITGQARSAFAKSEATVESFVEVFESRRDAAGDFRKGTAPKVLACVGPELERQARKAGLDMRVESVRLTGRPALGERAFAYRLVFSVAVGMTSVRLYMDVLGVQRGRSGVGLYFTGTRPVPGRLAVARSVAARMR